MSGLELLSRLRSRARMPLIVVSGREAESERVLAFDLGADDFVLKPFLTREFAARVRAALRRVASHPTPPSISPTSRSGWLLATSRWRAGR